MGPEAAALQFLVALHALLLLYLFVFLELEVIKAFLLAADVTFGKRLPAADPLGARTGSLPAKLI